MQKHWEVTVIRRSGFPSTVYIWTVNTVRASKEASEMFQTLMEKAYYSWNVFLGAPDILCECWKKKIWSIFFFVCLYQETCEQRDSQHLQLYLAWGLQFTSENLFVQKKIVFAKKLWRLDVEQSRRIPFSSPSCCFFFCRMQLITRDMCTAQG